MRRWMAWLLFVFTGGLMVLGAVVGPQNQPLAQQPSEPPTLEGVGASPEPGEEVADDMPAAAAPSVAAAAEAARQAAEARARAQIEPRVQEQRASAPAGPRTELRFTVDPTHDPMAIDTPTLGGVTADVTPQIRGTAKPKARVEILIDNQPAGVVNADEHGQWVLTSAELGAGEHTVAVRPGPPEQKKPTLKVGEGDASSIGSRRSAFWGSSRCWGSRCCCRTTAARSTGSSWASG